MNLTSTPVWTSLTELGGHAAAQHFRDLLAADPERAQTCHVAGAGWTLDWSRQRVSQQAIAALHQLATERAVPQAVEAMFCGAHINTTEDRAVLHTALRAPASASVIVDGHDAVAMAQEVLARMAAFTTEVLHGVAHGATGKPFTDVVNIGIGGSDLGPVMVTQALKDQISGLRPHFISNVDPTDARNSAGTESRNHIGVDCIKDIHHR